MSQFTTLFEPSHSAVSPAGGVSGRSRRRMATAPEGFPSRSQPGRNPKNTIPAVNRAMDLVRILAEDENETHTKALALRLGIPPTTCYRILCSLIGRGWVQRVASGRHVLAPLLQPLRWAEQAAQVIQPRLLELAARVRSDAILSLRQGDYTVVIAHGAATQPTPSLPWSATSLHLTAGSSGAVFLSRCQDDAIREVLHRTPPACWTRQSPEDVWQRINACRAKGWCADHDALKQGVSTISAPLCDEHQKLFAAMTLVDQAHGLLSNRMAGPVQTLIKAARQSERELCRLTSPPPCVDAPDFKYS